MKPFLLATFGILLAFAPSIRSSAQTAPMQGHMDDGVAHMGKKPIPPSEAVNVTVGDHTLTLTLDELKQLPQTSVHVHNAHSGVEETYAGPLLSLVLARAGLPSGKEGDQTILHSALLVTGTDGYYVLYSAAEAVPAFSKGQVIVAVTKDGQPDTAGGMIQLINTTDAKPARWVHGLSSLHMIMLGNAHAITAMSRSPGQGETKSAR